MAPSFDNGSSLFNFVVRDGNGVKGIVDSGISKVPRAFIQPPTEQINKNNATKCEIPPIDLSKLDGPEHDQVVNQIVRAAETLGFFQVVNHGAVYRKEVSPSPLVKYGTSFVPEKEKALEWKDYISMAYTNDDEALQQWPVECRDFALQYLKTSHEMVTKLLDALMGNLGVELDDSIIDTFIGKKMVNMNFYPTYGIGGLYVKVPEDVDMEKKGEWVEIPPIPDALVINVGDMLQILSNGRYKSAEHRVRATSTKSRVSVPIFVSPQATQKIAPFPQVVEKDGVARYSEFIFSDYMNNFFGNAHDGKKSLEFAKSNSA
ncbi:Scopoletin 8- Hydroxylase [Hibiscus trionum]|uniref:Scopoletin 8- Hydroxylase n=1 Tax=Hibiscus trionum TaxID=183268 RepID=A0A9W7J7A7_HIBTR|nr:Scopoletin 8- Hydroxylase [Hibiscus trionum]